LRGTFCLKLYLLPVVGRLKLCEDKNKIKCEHANRQNTQDQAERGVAEK